jgi:hypothetical protein
MKEWQTGPMASMIVREMNAGIPATGHTIP